MSIVVVVDVCICCGDGHVGGVCIYCGGGSGVCVYCGIGDGGGEVMVGMEDCVFIVVVVDVCLCYCCYCNVGEVCFLW